MHHATKGQLAKAATRNAPEEDPEFQIAPMIDILLVLLVFFMSISSTQVLQTNDSVRLPVAKDGKQMRPEQDGTLVVNVLWNPMNSIGSVDVEGQTFATPMEIGPWLKSGVDKNPECRVLVRADREVRYEFLRKVLEVAGKSGVSNITFSVVDKEGGG